MKSALPHNSWVLKHSIPHCGIGTSTELVQICVRVLKTRIPLCGIGSSTKIGTIKAADLILRFHSVESTLPQRSLKSVGVQNLRFHSVESALPQKNVEITRRVQNLFFHNAVFYTNTLNRGLSTGAFDSATPANSPKSTGEFPLILPIPRNFWQICRLLQNIWLSKTRHVVSHEKAELWQEPTACT